MDLAPIEYVIMRPSKEVARVVHALRNDHDALVMSFDSTAHSFEEFYPRFLIDYFLLKDLPSLFAIINGEKIAYIRFRPFIGSCSEGKRCAEISINVAPAFRGKGIGTQILQEMKKLAKQQGYEAIWAEIKPENKASKGAFLAAGYSFQGTAHHEVVVQGRQIVFAVELYCASLMKKHKKRTFVIAEAGSNWRLGNIESDIKMAEALIYAAKEAGCDAIKFQTFSPSSLYVPNAGTAQYLEREGDTRDITEILKKVAMPHGVIHTLASLCKAARIEFMSTAFSPKDFKAIDPYVKRHKIASYEIGHVHLLDLAAKSKKPLLLSTGASSLSEIAWAVSYFSCRSKALLTILQCTACYPAPVSSMHLRTIDWMQKYFQLPCGLSDHSADCLSAPLAAVALGATVIEKHITLDRRLPGPDQGYAIEPHELCELVRRIREVEYMLGDEVKKIDREEEELFFFAKRALQAKKEIAIGDVFQEGKNIAILRPGNQKKGIHPKFLPVIEGKKATRAIHQGDGIQEGDWQ